jgi:chromate transporter
MAIKSPPKWMRNMRTNLIVLSGIGFWQYDAGTLWKIAYFFSNAGAFVFGSGLAIVPFLHAGVVVEYQWLNEKQFLDAVAVAMITPGPLIMTVGFIGYIVAGFPGAVIAAVATFLPCYLITIVTAPFFRKLATNPSIKIFVEGITASILGSLIRCSNINFRSFDRRYSIRSDCDLFVFTFI